MKGTYEVQVRKWRNWACLFATDNFKEATQRYDDLLADRRANVGPFYAEMRLIEVIWYKG